MVKYHEIRIKQIDAALNECDRFIKRARDWRKRLEEEQFFYGSTEGGYCKRSSMDLARALVPLRKTIRNA